MLENQRKKKLRFYSLIVVLAFCLILPIVATSVLSQPPNQKPTTTPADQTTSPSPGPNVSENDTNLTAGAPEATPNSSNQTVLLTKDEALKIAMPLIEKYASENGRVISSVNATFYPSSRDICGSRTGNPTPFQPILDSQKVQSYPEWSIEAYFEPIDGMPAPGQIPMPTGQGWIYGYCVLIWADNGQIRSSNAQGIC